MDVARSGLAILALLVSAVTAQAKESCTAPAGTVPIEFRSGENTLRGFLDKPPTPGRHPLMLILHGSGSTEVMGGNGGYNSSYDELRAAFRRAGFATAVWDKAFSGCSKGRYVIRTPIVERTDEAVAALDALKARDDVDPARIGVWAISEAAWIAPMMAVRRPEIAFLILVSAPGGDAEEETVFLAFNLLTQSGVSTAEARQAVATLRRAFLIANAGGSHAEFLAAIEPLEKYPVFAELRITETPEMKTSAAAAADYRLNQRASDYVLRADTFLRQLRQPTLVIYGGRDIQVDTRTSERLFREAFARSGNNQLTIKVFPEAGHNLYGADSTTFVKGYVDLMVDWLKQRKTER